MHALSRVGLDAVLQYYPPKILLVTGIPCVQLLLFGQPILLIQTPRNCTGHPGKLLVIAIWASLEELLSWGTDCAK